MNTEFGLLNLWNQGDLITKGVALLLLAMSLATWIVIIIKALDLRRFAAQARHAESFWHAADFADGLGKLGPDLGNPFRALALEGR
ncbi:MAG: tolQ, partial [Ramlibacter sp.]|nr:tolQ [Ramlibacter sp.]